MSRYLTSIEAAKIIGCSVRHLQRLCVKGRLSGAIKDGSQWRVPLSADMRLASIKTPEDLSNTDELLNVPASKRSKALRRLGIVKEFDRFATVFVSNGGTRSEAFKKFVKTKPNVSNRSLERWISSWRKQGLVGLVDGRGGGKFASQMISPEAFERFSSMYLDSSQLSLKTCWQNINQINRQEQKSWKIPSLGQMYRVVDGMMPLPVIILHREGLAAYEAKCAPYIQSDPDSVLPGQIWVGDHHQLNCWIRHRGRWVRPWITAWLDMRSRCVVGFHISVNPNQTTILLATKRSIERYGPPDSVKIDNGKDYDSQLWTGITKSKRRALKAGYIDEQFVVGIYAMMDIGISFAIPYHPQSKRIERWFDTLDMQFTKTIPTYCGKDVARKPDNINEFLAKEKTIASAYNMTSFTETITEYVKVYNNTAHSGSGMQGMSPAAVMATRQSRRVLAEGVLDLLLRVWSPELKVGKNGVRFNGLWYGQHSLDLFARQGKQVRLAYDPDDLACVHVYDAVTMQLITKAEQNKLISYGSKVSEESLRQAMKEKSKALRATKEFKQSRLAANMDITSLTLKAQAEANKVNTPTHTHKTTQRLKPVATAMDNQVREHDRLDALKAVKRAAGAEGIEAVLDIDFTLLNKNPKKAELKLFNG